MGIGNSKDQQSKLTRKDSSRWSLKKKKNNQRDGKLEQENTTDDIIVNKKTCLRNLKESASQHEDKLNRLKEILDSFDDKAEEIKIVSETSVNKAKSNIENDCRDNIETKEYRAPIQTVLQEFQVLKDSFKEVQQNIEECVNIFEENNTVDGDINGKQMNASFRRKGKNSLATESKHGGGFSATVQLFNKQPGKLINDIQTKLQIKLKSRLENVTFVPLKDISRIDNNTLLIITCTPSTRLEADAADAIKDIQNPANTVLLLVHVDEEIDLSNTNSSARLIGDKFKCLRGIFDMSYKNDYGGFTQCEMNENSIHELCSVCKEKSYTEKL